MKSQDSPGSGDVPSVSELRTARLVLLLGAALNLVFWGTRRLLGLGGADPLWQRLALSGGCLALGLASLGPTRWRGLVLPGLDALAWGGTYWWIHRAAASGLTPEFAVGMFVPPAVLSLLVRRPGHHLAYAAFTLLAGAWEFSRILQPAVSPVLTLACLGTMLLLMHLQIRTRMRAVREATGTDQLRDAIGRHTTDAILLVDPAKRVTIECNSRARAMFGVPAGSTVVPFAAVLACAERGSEFNVGAVAASLLQHGIHQARIRPKSAGEPGVPAALAVRVVRMGRRDIWLVRITSEPAAGGVPPPALEDPPEGRAAELRGEELAMFRRVLIAVAVILPGLWLLRRSLGLVPADPLWQRLVLSGLCLLLATATGGPRWLRRHLHLGIAGLAFVGSVWWIVRVAAAGLRPDYAVGLMVVPASIGLSLHRSRLHAAYVVVVLAACAALFLPLPDPGTNPWFVLLSLSTLLGMTHLLLRGRLRSYDDLLEADDLRAALFEFTSDALALADPISHAVLDCNARARALFGAPPALRDLLARPALGVADIVLMMKDLAMQGGYRRELLFSPPDRTPFAGELSVTSVQHRHRPVWLIRVAVRPAGTAPPSPSRDDAP